MEPVNVFKAGLVCHGEDDQEAISRPHVLLPHRTELLLASCVQHCQDGGTPMYYITLNGLCFTDVLIQNAHR